MRIALFLYSVNCTQNYTINMLYYIVYKYHTQSNTITPTCIGCTISCGSKNSSISRGLTSTNCLRANRDRSPSALPSLMFSSN